VNKSYKDLPAPLVISAYFIKSNNFSAFYSLSKEAKLKDDNLPIQ
jgi:hypothetical protein